MEDAETNNETKDETKDETNQETNTNETETETTIKCRKCLAELTTNQFYKHKNDKLFSVCKSCMNQARTENYRKKNKDNVRQEVNKNNFVNQMAPDKLEELRNKLLNPSIKKKYLAIEFGINYPNMMYYYNRHVKKK